MATKTTNYNLTKPSYDENADIAVVNGNMDIIDTKMKEIADKTDNNSVGWNQLVNSGTKIAEITVGGNKKDVYAPAGGGSTITVDSQLSETSTNPVQNKVITAELDGLKSDLGEKISKPSITDNNKFPRAKDGNVEWVELGFVIPQMFGAVGDGVHDDTEAIQNAFNSGEKIFFPKGTYCVSVGDTANDYNFYSALKIPSNTIVDFNGSIIQCSPVDGNAKEKYTVIYLDECDNVLLKNGVIIGDKLSHIGNFSEYGHGIATFRCRNAKIDNMTIYEHIGDGICMQAEYATSTNPVCSSDNIIVSNCEIYNCRRQGISVIGANNVHIDLCYIHDIFGTYPQSCIDIEGNVNERNEFPTNIIISNCRLLNTADSYRGLLVYDRAYEVFAFGCECSDITLYGKCSISSCFIETFHNFADEESKLHGSTIGTVFSNGYWSTFVNCDITKEIRLTVQSSREHCTLKFENCSIHGFANSSNANNYDLIFIGCYFSIDNYIRIETVNSIEFYNCTIETKERILAGKIGIVKMRNCNILIDSSVSTGIFYRTAEIKEVEIVSCSFIGNNPKVANGLLFGGDSTQIIKSMLFLGNICNDRSILYGGTVESVVSSNNYPTSLNY